MKFLTQKKINCIYITLLGMAQFRTFYKIVIDNLIVLIVTLIIYDYIFELTMN